MPPIEIEVIAKSKGTAVVTLSGRRAPLLVLRRDVVTQFQKSAEAVLTRIRDGYVDADAIDAFADLLKSLTDQYETESERFTNRIWDAHKDDTDAVGREFNEEMDALKQLWHDGGGSVA